VNQDPSLSPPRRSFLTRLNIGAASLAAMAGAALAQQKAPDRVAWAPARHDQDDWLDNNRAKHRVVFDSVSTEGLADAGLFASNYYRVNQKDYALESADLAVVIVLRHRSALFGYNDAMWAKYGEPMAARAKVEDPKTKQAPKVNLFNLTGTGEAVLNHGITLDSLAKLGAQFAVCRLSTRAYASGIAKATGGKSEDILSELSANLIANARLVPAGIVAVNRAQERGYTLMGV
jgi:intracellular sulfur oxidation DsrE/DsrF family protein